MKCKVFTFNLRVDTKTDGINVFENRKGRVLATVREYAPDLIGFQEANDDMRAWLRTALTDYTVVGCGRNADYRGESPVLAYKTADFEAVWSENFWLSATPNVPGTRYGFDQSNNPRVTTAVCLKRKDTAGTFVFCNTHFDHVGKTARLFSSVQLMQYLAEKKLPFVLTGDFNARPNTPEIGYVTGIPGYPVTDLTAGLPGTFHDFGRREENAKIDYVFTNLEADAAESFIVPDEPQNGVYISDHFPVCAFVNLP